MKMLSMISRLFVGSLFIVSGLIKANDPLGFSYKLEEYFSADVLNLPFFEPFALELSIFICVVEIVLGVAAILGAKMRLVSWSLLLLILFFTFLTFYSAYFNKVTDCGCFGDALKLTPWQSFSKDIILLVFVLVLFIEQKKIESNTFAEDLLQVPMALVLVGVFSIGVIGWVFPLWFSIVLFAIVLLLKHKVSIRGIDWLLAGVATLISTSFSVYCLQNLPIKDFRPYAIGKSIPEQMKVPAGAEPDVYENVLTYQNAKTGETKDFSYKEFVDLDISNNEDWEWRDTKSKLVKKGYSPPIKDFSLIADDGNDYSEDILAEAYVFLLISPDIKKANKKFFTQAQQLASQAYADGYYFFGLSASGYDEVEKLRHEYQLQFDYYSADEILLKTIVRSNPGLLMLKEGRVIGKWHHNNFPEYSEIKALMQ